MTLCIEGVFVKYEIDGTLDVEALLMDERRSPDGLQICLPCCPSAKRGMLPWLFSRFV